MGDIQRIFYYHFASAMLTFFFFFISFAASIVYLALRNRDPLRAMSADALALAGAEMGVVFCTAVLIQGPLWARPVWGIWWTWDARLTSTLVMWLIYCSYLLVRRFAAGAQMQTAGGGGRDLRICGRADRLLLDAMVAYPASFAGDCDRRP